MRPSLVLRYGDRRFTLSRGAIAVGRLEECELALDGPEISRRHARIVATPEGPLLVDRSRFGTYLNGSQVVAPTLLQPGDQFELIRLVFEDLTRFIPTDNLALE